MKALSLLFALLLSLPLAAATPKKERSVKAFPGYYRLISAESGKLIECNKLSSGVFEIYQRSYLGTKAQEWEIIQVDKGYHKIINREHGFSLDLPLGSSRLGEKISVWEYIGGANQQWKFERSKTGFYEIRNRASGNYLDLVGFSKEEKAPIQSWSRNGAKNQLWRVEKVSPKEKGVYYVDNGHIKVGLDLDCGGSISWISESGTDRNVVNTKDLGRFIQQSYYSGTFLDRRDEGQSEFWSPFPWNAIQAGDYYGNKPNLMEFRVEEDVIYTKTRPMLWDMNDDNAQAYIESWIKLEGNEIIYRGKLTRFLSHNPWGKKKIIQELPAIYLEKSLKSFFSYTGSDLWNGHLNAISGEKVWERWVSHESWVACVDNSLWGVGVYMPGVADFAGGHYPADGKGDDPTSYMAPIIETELDANDTFEFTCYISLGHLSKIQHNVYMRRHKLELRRLGIITE